MKYVRGCWTSFLIVAMLDIKVLNLTVCDYGACKHKSNYDTAEYKRQINECTIFFSFAMQRVFNFPCLLSFQVDTNGGTYVLCTFV